MRFAPSQMNNLYMTGLQHAWAAICMTLYKVFVAIYQIHSDLSLQLMACQSPCVRLITKADRLLKQINVTLLVAQSRNADARHDRHLE